MPHKPKRICTDVGRQVARVTAHDLQLAEPLELVGLAVACHNLAVMSVEELNRRLPVDDRVEVAATLPNRLSGKGKQARLVH
jgi:hypothetical protein